MTKITAKQYRRLIKSSSNNKATEEAKRVQRWFLFWCGSQKIKVRTEVPMKELIPDCGRRFRFDFYLPDHGIVIEFNGGTWSGKKSGHGFGKGYESDLEKANLCSIHKITYLQYTYSQIKKGLLTKDIEKLVL